MDYIERIIFKEYERDFTSKIVHFSNLEPDYEDYDDKYRCMLLFNNNKPTKRFTIRFYFYK